MTIWKCKDVGHSQKVTKNLRQLFEGKMYFDYPKSIKLIKRCIELYSDEDSIILDFFYGYRVCPLGYVIIVIIVDSNERISPSTLYKKLNMHEEVFQLEKLVIFFHTMENNENKAIGFIMGYFKQYDSIVGYTLEEIIN